MDAMGERKEHRQGSAAALSGRRLADMTKLVPSFFGFAFVRAWDDLVFSRFAALFPDTPWLGQDIVSLGMLPVFFLIVFAARRLAPLYRRPVLVIGAPLLMVASVVFYELLLGMPDGTQAALVLVALLAGAGAALSILQWAELQSCLNSLQIVLYVSGSFFLGSLLGWMALDAGPERMAVVLLLLPALSLFCLKTAFAKIATSDLPKNDWGAVRFPWKLVIVLGVYEFAMGVTQGDVAFGEDAPVLGVLAASAVLFCLAFFFSHRFDFTRIYRTPFVLMVCGLLAALLSFSASNAVANVLVSTGYALMFLLLTMLLCDISHRYGVSAALLCSIEELVMFTGVGGHLVAQPAVRAAVPLLQDGTVLSISLAVLVVIASMVLLSEREYSRWGASFFGVGSRDSEADVRAAFVERCDELALQHRLSPREKEVFQLIAEGKSPSEIEGELYIASGTLKSHTRRIYQKFDVHSRGELVALLQENKG